MTKAAKLCAEIKAMEDELDCLRWLCGVMLATLMLPANQPHLPPVLRTIAKTWQAQFTTATPNGMFKTATPYALQDEAEACPSCKDSGRRCAYCGQEGTGPGDLQTPEPEGD